MQRNPKTFDDGFYWKFSKYSPSGERKWPGSEGLYREEREERDFPNILYADYLKLRKQSILEANAWVYRNRNKLVADIKNLNFSKLYLVIRANEPENLLNWVLYSDIEGSRIGEGRVSSHTGTWQTTMAKLALQGFGIYPAIIKTLQELLGPVNSSHSLSAGAHKAWQRAGGMFTDNHYSINPAEEPLEETQGLFDFIMLTLRMIPDKTLQQECIDLFEHLEYQLDAGIIPENTPPDFWEKRSLSLDVIPRKSYIEATMAGINITHMCQRYRMYAFIHQAFAAALARVLNSGFGSDATYLELMAGRGWLAKGLQQEGLRGNYIAVDLDSRNALYPIKTLDAREAVIKYRDTTDCYLLSWPYYDDEAAAEAVREIPVGSPILYLGEWHGNAGTPSLFQQLRPIPADELTSAQRHAQQEYFTWYGYHDSLCFCIKV